MIITYHNTVVNSYDSFSCHLIKLSLNHWLLVESTWRCFGERDIENYKELARGYGERKVRGQLTADLQLPRQRQLGRE